jgi:hypothetical protein
MRFTFLSSNFLAHLVFILFYFSNWFPVFEPKREVVTTRTIPGTEPNALSITTWSPGDALRPFWREVENHVPCWRISVLSSAFVIYSAYAVFQKCKKCWIYFLQCLFLTVIDFFEEVFRRSFSRDEFKVIQFAFRFLKLLEIELRSTHLTERESVCVCVEIWIAGLFLPRWASRWSRDLVSQWAVPL